MFEIIIPIYDIKLLVSIGQTDKEFLSSLKKTKFKCGKQCLIPDAEAYFIPFEGAHLLIRCKHKLKKPSHIGILSHEVLHATIYILHRAGFRLTKHSEEAFTYLQEYIVTQILKKWKVLKQGQIKINRK